MTRIVQTKQKGGSMEGKELSLSIKNLDTSIEALRAVAEKPAFANTDYAYYLATASQEMELLKQSLLLAQRAFREP